MDELSNLVVRCRTRARKDDLNELLRAVHPDLVLALQAYCGRDDALLDDFIQEAMIKVVLQIRSSRATTFREFRAWCVRIATRIAADYYRKASVKKLSILDPSEIEKLREAGAGEQSSEFGGSSDVLEVLETLGSPCRELLTLHYIHGLDYAEIAANHAKSYDAVRIAIRRCCLEAQQLFERKARYAE